MPQLLLPDLLFAAGRPHQDAGLLVGDDGLILRIMASRDKPDVPVVRLQGKALLPGLANAHSHSFQRLFRSRAEGRVLGGDTFWTWREQMYRAAHFLSPEGVYDVARAAFLEMLASGITIVGEFHYLHNDRDGDPYSDPNELAHAVIRAAESVGIRICLLRAAYQRAGFQREPHPGQRRFYEAPDAYLRNLEALLNEYRNAGQVHVGAAPHSIRAVPLTQLRQIAAMARRRRLPWHMHISEQPAENEACLAEYGQTPITLLNEHGILDARTTLVHAIHLTADEFVQTAHAGSTICSCPTTERNLGDGIFPADRAAQLEIPIAFGTDSQAQIDILEDARQFEYHLRLARRERGILDGIHEQPIAERLFRSATQTGYGALGVQGGRLAPGEPADFFTADLDDLALLGADRDSLVSQAVFALGRTAVRDVAVAGRFVLRDGQHPLACEIRARYRHIQHSFLTEEGQ
jgi:formimidoylglutamate deiminase